MTFINLAINNLIHRISLKNKNPQSNYVFMSEILLNDFNNIYPLEKDLPQNKLNEQDIVRTLAVCYHQAKKHEEVPSDKCSFLIFLLSYCSHRSENSFIDKSSLLLSSSLH
jgi:hypothetical protein